MVNTSPIFGLQYLFQNQSQKEVYVNQDLTVIDAFLQPTVISNVVYTPPPTPADGDKYIVPTGSSGVWAGQTNAIAMYSAPSMYWSFYTPKIGWIVYNQAYPGLFLFTGTAWTPYILRGTFTLTPSATSTVITTSACFTTSVVLYSPNTPNAANDMATTSIVPANGSFTITHANNARVDRTFKYVIV
jgi:hypothetical protein